VTQQIVALHVWKHVRSVLVATIKGCADTTSLKQK
jgi:hypothetical protein